MVLGVRNTRTFFAVLRSPGPFSQDYNVERAVVLACEINDVFYGVAQFRSLFPEYNVERSVERFHACELNTEFLFRCCAVPVSVPRFTMLNVQLSGFGRAKRTFCLRCCAFTVRFPPEYNVERSVEWFRACEINEDIFMVLRSTGSVSPDYNVECSVELL